MVQQCPHCKKDLPLNEAQQSKVKIALASLPTGKTLKIGCPLCHQNIEMRPDGSVVPPKKPEAAKEEAPRRTGMQATPPPNPPNLDWLRSGEEFGEKEAVEDVPMVLILMTEGEARRAVAEAFTNQGYKPIFPRSAEDAMERMRFSDFAGVVLHGLFEGDSMTASSFHDYMKALPMYQRRHIFYVLVGPELKTFYDLEALALSANLVVNDNDTPKFELLLKKALPEYQQLFGHFLEQLEAHGKR